MPNPTYKQLKPTNAAYDPIKLTHLDLLYKGGYDLQANARQFLKKLNSETEQSYEDRISAASYLPYFSDIINSMAANVFAAEVSVTASDDTDAANTGKLPSESVNEVYKKFFAQADRNGRSFIDCMRHVLTGALKHRKYCVGIDFPRTEQAPTNLLEEEQLGTSQPYLYDIDPLCIVDWSLNDDGTFNWLKLRSDVFVQPGPLTAPQHYISYLLWEMVEGKASFQVFDSALMPLTRKEPNLNEEFKLTAGHKTSFNIVPVLCLCLPEGIDLGNKIGPICEDIYQRTTILVTGENKSINAMRVVKLGEETGRPGGASVSTVQENPYRADNYANDWEAMGWGVLGANDDIEIVETQGAAFQVVAEQIDGLIEKLKETVSQMANSSTSQTKSAARSAASKQEDRRSMEIVLQSYGIIMKDFIKRIMTTISDARGESIVWAVNGLEEFQGEDKDQLILEAAQFSNIVSQAQGVSPTFTKKYLHKFYTGLLDGILSHDENTQIFNEVNEAVDSGALEPAEPEETDNKQDNAN